MKQEGKAKKVFICSPFRPKGETVEEREVDLQWNQQLASKACKLAVNCGYNPLAPHLFFPEFLSDEDPDEREQGIQLGQEWLAESDELWVVGNRITEGMKMEIGLADQLGIPMKHVTFRRITREQYQKEQRELMEQKDQKEGAKVSTEQKKETTDKNTSILDQLKAGIDEALEEMEKAMDENFMETGKTLAELFRSLCTAALKLPTMELHTELMCVTNTDEGLSVYFDRDRLENGDCDEFDDPGDGEYDYCDHCAHCDHSDRYDDHDDYDYDDFDDEEEWSYEED